MKAPLRSGTDRYELIGLAAIPAQTGAAATLCWHCGTAAPDRLARVVGAWSVIEGEACWDCETCARARLEEIESGVDINRRPA